MHRPLHRGGGGGHDRNDGPHQRQQHRCQHDGYAQKEGGRVPRGQGGLLPIPRAGGPADGDGGPHGEPHDHHREHVHHLGADGDGGGAGDDIELADDEEVRHAVERLEEVGEQVGQREAEDGLEDASGGEVLFHGDHSFFA